MQKRFLQVVLAILAFIPFGTGVRDLATGINKYHILTLEFKKVYDNEFRFSAGVWLALGLVTFYIIPRIEKETKLFRAIMLMIITGGVGRLVSVISLETFTTADLINLFLELVLCPILIVWQNRVHQLSVSLCSIHKG